MAPFSGFLVAALVVVAVTGEADAGGRNYGPKARYDRVLSFGDSLTDTGNSAILPVTAGGPFANPPYGETYFHHPSGRASDGRIVIDFIVEWLRLPQPTPYLAGRTADDFRHGVNFAVGGATALDMAFLRSKGITSLVPVFLSNQTTWFNGVLQLLASRPGPERRKFVASSLFYLGEIGFNDYSFAIKNGTVGLAESLVPHIVGVIRSALIDVIAAGARTVVVAGMIPMGCSPELLTLLRRGSGAGDYHDRASAGCITGLNNLAQLHNRELNRMLCQLRRAHPRTSIHYGNYYHPVTAIVSSPQKYGFGGMPLAACCGGGGGPYNFNFTFFCGTPLSRACADPSRSVSWDGIHYTEAANRFVAQAMLRGL